MGIANITPNLIADMNQSQTALNTAVEQLATGQSVSEPSQGPTASAQMVENTLETGNVDQYTQNISSVLATVENSNSVLSDVVTQLTQAVSLGTGGASGTNTNVQMQEIASQVETILSTVVSAANTSVAGTYLFSGTGTTPPYVPDASSASGYTYAGNQDSVSVAVGDNLNLPVNLPGTQIFSASGNDVLGSLSSLVSALQSGDTTQVQSAVAAVDSTISYVGQQQAFYTNAEDQLNAQEDFLKQEMVILSTQATNLVGVNESTAAVNLEQAENQNAAAEAAAAKVLPNTLLNYLEPPS
ncbi:MAG: flagellar hook-associated protein FlgL [Acidobacteriaceae bacterium]